MKCLEALLIHESRISNEYLAYQQGYALGEKLHQAYEQRRFPRKELRDLFSRSFPTPYESLIEFLSLKYKRLV